MSVWQCSSPSRSGWCSQRLKADARGSPRSMPHAVAWDVEPPRPTEPEEKQEDDQKETLDHPSVPATCSGVQVRRNTWTVWAHRLRSTSKAKGQRKKREA